MQTNIISVTDAAIMTARCSAQKENILAPARQNEGIVPTCETFTKAAFESLLSISGCTAVRIYSAMDADLKIRFVICGVNSNNEDIIIADTSSSEEPIPSVVENGSRCPDYCPPDSPLNS